MSPHPINWEAIGVLTGMIGGPVLTTLFWLEARGETRRREVIGLLGELRQEVSERLDAIEEKLGVTKEKVARLEGRLARRRSDREEAR